MAAQGGLVPGRRATKAFALAAGALCAAILLPLASSAQSARVPHPEPRVIVNVTAIRGGHQAQAVQRAARETWGRIVRCYKDDGTRDRGKVVLRLEISAAGQVIGARRLSSDFSDGLARCLSDGLRRKTMPKARSGSSATIEIQLAPGDD